MITGGYPFLNSVWFIKSLPTLPLPSKNGWILSNMQWNCDTNSTGWSMVLFFLYHIIKFLISKGISLWLRPTISPTFTPAFLKVPASSVTPCFKNQEPPVNRLVVLDKGQTLHCYLAEDENKRPIMIIYLDGKEKEVVYLGK